MKPFRSEDPEPYRWDAMSLGDMWRSEEEWEDLFPRASWRGVWEEASRGVDPSSVREASSSTSSLGALSGVDSELFQGVAPSSHRAGGAQVGSARPFLED